MLAFSEAGVLMAIFGRNFALLWQGQLVSQLGNQAFLIATTIYLLEGTGSATLVATAMMAGTIPLAVVGPIGGAIADRHSRRRILMLTDWARAASIGGLAVLVFSRPDITRVHISLVVAVAMFNGIMSALFSPAFQSLVPDLVPGEDLPTANAINQVSTQTSTLVGQALGGVLYVAWGPATLLIFDAASFAYAGVATWLLPVDRIMPREPLPLAQVLRRYIVDTRGGVSYVWQRRGLTSVLAVFAGVNCLFMPVYVLLPFYVRDVIAAGPQWYGFLLSGAGVGALLGSVTAGVVLRRLGNPTVLVRVCLAGVAGGVLLLATTDVSWLALAAFVLMGAQSSMINVAVITRFQSAVPASVRGRVMALVIAVATAAAPLGMAFGGVVGDMWRSSLPTVIAASGAAIAILATFGWTSAAFGRFFSREESLAET